MKWPRLVVLAIGALVAAATAATADPRDQSFHWRDASKDAVGPGSYVPSLPAMGKSAPQSSNHDLQQVTWQDRGGQWELRLTFGGLLKPGTEPVLHVYLDTDGVVESGVMQPLHGSGRLAMADGMGWEKVLVVAPAAPGRLQAELRAKAGIARGAVVVPASQKPAGKSWVIRLDKEVVGTPKATWSLGVAVLAFTDRPPADGLLSMPVRKSATISQWGGGEDAACGSHVIDVLVANSGPAKTRTNPQFDLLGFACGGKSAVLPLQPFFPRSR